MAVASSLSINWLKDSLCFLLLDFVWLYCGCMIHWLVYLHAFILNVLSLKSHILPSISTSLELCHHLEIPVIIRIFHSSYPYLAVRCSRALAVSFMLVVHANISVNLKTGSNTVQKRDSSLWLKRHQPEQRSVLAVTGPKCLELSSEE